MSKTKRGKGDLEGNEDYFKSFDDFQTFHKANNKKGPVLLPINVDIVDGVISRRRLTAAEVREIEAEYLDELEAHCDLFGEHVPNYYTRRDFKRLFKDYDIFFSPDDDQGMYPNSPLNIDVRHKAILLFRLGRTNWKFTKNRHIQINNDRNDLARNCAQICTLNSRKILLVENKFLSKQTKMSYDLFVTVRQREEGKYLYTDIIIDPGMDNDDGSGGPGGGLPPNNNGG